MKPKNWSGWLEWTSRILASSLIALSLPAYSRDCSPKPIVEGAVFQEERAPEVYVIHDGKKVWIPTPDALFRMGYDWDSRILKCVPDHHLDGLPRFNMVPIAMTPGSILHPPDEGKVFYRLEGVPTAVNIKSRGKWLRIGELRGWIRGVEASDAGCGDGKDFHYELELDTEWALEQGINLHSVLRVGNVVIMGIKLNGNYLGRRTVSLPLVHIELDSWNRWPGDAPLQGPPPADWKYERQCTGGVRLFPFDPYQPPTSSVRLEAHNLDLTWRGPYIRIFGSLVTDWPHDDNAESDWKGSRDDWSNGKLAHDRDHLGRWTEIHTVDFFEVLPDPGPRVTQRAVALAAQPGKCEAVVFDIFPDHAPRPNGAQINFNEYRGPEGNFPEGEGDKNYSKVDAFDDHVHVKAQVCGKAGGIFGIGGEVGRFKAIYRVWWENAPSDTTSNSGSNSDTGGHTCPSGKDFARCQQCWPVNRPCP